MTLISKIRAAALALALVSCSNYATNYPKKDNLEWTGLECDNPKAVQVNGSEFYACEEDMTDVMMGRLEQVADIKKFVQGDMGLPASKNYLVYKDEKPKMLYILWITPPGKGHKKEKLFYIPLPIHAYGLKSPYQIFSKKDDLLDEKDHYEKKGYDVYYFATADYYLPTEKTGCDLHPGFFEEFPSWEQAETIIHEDWHHYIKTKKPNIHKNNALNESSALIMGLIGSIEFTKQKYGEDHIMHRLAKAGLEHDYELIIHTNHYHRLLKNIDSSGMSKKEKVKEKEALLKQTKTSKKPLDENKISVFRPYTTYAPLIYWVYREQGFEKTMEIMNGMPDSEDATDFIKYMWEYL